MRKDRKVWNWRGDQALGREVLDRGPDEVNVEEEK